MAEDTRANYAQVLGALCGPSQEPLGKGGTVSVQKHLSTGLPPHYTKKKYIYFTSAESYTKESYKSELNKNSP